MKKVIINRFKITSNYTLGYCYIEHDLLYKITFIQNKLNSDYYLKHHEKN